MATNTAGKTQKSVKYMVKYISSIVKELKLQYTDMLLKGVTFTSIIH